MRIQHHVYGALLFFTTVTAFIPWSPPYLCLKEGTCKPDKRSIEDGFEASGVESNEGVTKFKLVRRTVKSTLPRFNGRRQIESRDVGLGNDLSPRATVTAQAPTQTNALGIDQDGGNNQYFIQAQFGSNNTPLLMLMDTGGSQTWVMGSGCTQPSCTRHKTFGVANSTTIQLNTQELLEVDYGAGYVRGSYASDTIAIANLKFRISLGLAYNVSDSVGQYDFDGIWGLAQANPNAPNFLDALVASKQLKSNLFAVYLASIEDGPNDGEITFGGTDPSKYTGDIKYTSLDPQAGGLWALPLDNWGFGNQQLGSLLNGSTAIIDTGTTNIFATAQQASYFFAMIPGSASASGGYTVPCDTTTPILVTISGVIYTIPASDWIGPKANGVCFTNIGVMALPDKAGWLLGDMWLRQVYTVFDVDNKRVGIAMAKVPTAASSSIGSSTSSGTGPTGSITLTPSAPNTITTGSSSQSTGTSFVPGSVNVQSTPTSGPAVAQTTGANPSVTQKSDAVREGNGSFTTTTFAIAIMVMISTMVS